MAGERQLKRNAKGRKLQDPRNSFDWTTPNLNVVARPTDSYVNPADAGGASRRAAESIKSILGVVGNYKTLQDDLEPDNRKKARADFANKNEHKDKPFNFFNLGIGYNEEYGIAEGEAKGRIVKEQFDLMLRQNNYFIESDNPNEDIQELWDTTVANTFGETQDVNVWAGAEGQLKAAYIDGAMSFEEAQFNHMAENYMNNKMNIFTSTIRDMKYDPYSIKKVYNMMRKEMEDYSVKSLFTGAEIPMENIRTKDQLTKGSINVLGEEAVKILNDSTIPLQSRINIAKNIMKSFTLPDEDGIAWSTVKDAEGNYKFAEQIDSINDEINRTIKKVSGKHKDSLQKSIVIEMSELDDTSVIEAEALKEKIIANADNLDTSFIKASLTGLEAIIDGEGFPDDTDPDLKRELIRRHRTGNLDASFVENNHYRMSAKDYDDYLGKAIGDTSADPINQMYKDASYIWKQAYGDHIADFKRQLNPTNNLTGEFLFPGGANRVSRAIDSFNSWVDTFTHENNRLPNTEEMENKKTELLNTFQPPNIAGSNEESPISRRYKTQVIKSGRSPVGTGSTSSSESTTGNNSKNEEIIKFDYDENGNLVEVIE